MKLYVIQGKYFRIWEDVTTETDLKEAKQRLKEYNENELQYLHRLITRRVK
jgi:hypothetical protein